MGENPFLQFKDAAPLRAKPNGVLADAPYRGPVKANNRTMPVRLPAYSDLSQQGASAKARAAVASVYKASDKLAALRKFYPDAKPYGPDNFYFTDPKTKKQTIFNPKGFDRGDFIEQGRLVANVAGAAAGAAGGSVVAPGPGTIGGGAVGATTGGVLYDKALQAAFGLDDSRTAGEQVVDAATETALDLALTGVGGKVVRGTRNLLRSGDGAAVDAFTNIGVKPPVVASGSKGSKMVGGWLESQLGSSGRVTARTAQAVDEVGGVLKETVAKTTNAASKKDAGDIIKASAEAYIENGQKTASGLYAKVDELVPGDSRVPLTNFTAKLDELNNTFSGSPEWEAAFSSPDIKTWYEAAGVSAQKGGVEYQVLKRIRSDIGAAQRGQGPLKDLNSGELSALYKALAADMEEGARVVAGQPGVDAAKAATTYWQEFRGVVDNQITPTLYDGKKALPAEKVYTNFVSKVENAPSSLDVWQTVIPAEKRTELGAFVLRDGSKARPRTEGALADTADETSFSPTEYVANFNRRFNGPDQAPARNFFFGDKPELLETGQNVFTASGALKGAATETNNSRTAAVGGITGTIGAIPGLLFGGGADTALLGAAAANATATAASDPISRLFVSPTFESLLARPPIVPTAPTIAGTARNMGFASTLLRPLTSGESNVQTTPAEEEENPFLQYLPPQQ